jgi:hypothetical protein
MWRGTRHAPSALQMSLWPRFTDYIVSIRIEDSRTRQCRYTAVARRGSESRARACGMGQHLCGPAVPYNMLYRSICRVHGHDSGGTVQSDQQESPDNPSPRTIQHHAEATPFPLGACVPGLLQATGPSHRGDQVFPLSLPSRESGSIPSVARPGQRYIKAMAPASGLLAAASRAWRSSAASRPELSDLPMGALDFST